MPIIRVYLVDVWVFLRVSEHVESRVELVEHPNDFHGAFRVRVTGTVVAEADYAGKQQRHAFEPLRRNRPLVSQLRRHADRQHRVQQSETITARVLAFFFRFFVFFFFFYRTRIHSKWLSRRSFLPVIKPSRRPLRRYPTDAVVCRLGRLIGRVVSRPRIDYPGDCKLRPRRTGSKMSTAANCARRDILAKKFRVVNCARQLYCKISFYDCIVYRDNSTRIMVLISL